MILRKVLIGPFSLNHLRVTFEPEFNDSLVHTFSLLLDLAK